MTEESRRRNIALEVDRARRDLRAGEVLLESGLFESVVGHAYYCAFHHARALLLMEGLEAKTHGGVVHLLQRDLVRTSRFDARLAGALSTLQGLRQDADYDAAAVFTREMAEDALAQAREFQAAAEGLLGAEGYL